MKLLKTLAFLVAALLLGGCTAGPHTIVITKMINMGQEALPPSMLNHHLVAVVGFNEAYPGKASGYTNTHMYIAGIRKGTPEFSYRVVLLNMGNLDSLLWIRSGDRLFSTVGVVPDQIGELKAGDYVEYRNTLTFESLVNFSKTGKGNIVTKVLCRKAQPDFEACLDSLPKTGRHKGTGDTGRPFPASVKDYGFTFTPAYDKDGILLKPLPPA